MPTILLICCRIRCGAKLNTGLISHAFLDARLSTCCNGRASITRATGRTLLCLMQVPTWGLSTTQTLVGGMGLYQRPECLYLWEHIMSLDISPVRFATCSSNATNLIHYLTCDSISTISALIHSALAQYRTCKNICQLLTHVVLLI